MSIMINFPVVGRNHFWSKDFPPPFGTCRKRKTLNARMQPKVSRFTGVESNSTYHQVDQYEMINMVNFYSQRYTQLHTGNGIPF